MVFALAFALAGSLMADTCDTPEPVSTADIAAVAGKPPKSFDNFMVVRITPDDGPPGNRVFIKEEGRWLAYDVLQYSSDIVALKSSRDGRRMVWAWTTSEGPGQSFEGLIYTPGKATVCTRVDFSTVANRNEATGDFDWQMEYLSLDDVNIDARGRGALVASGDIDVNGKARHVTYVYRTRDGGRTWSAPVRVKKSYHPAGIYQ